MNQKKDQDPQIPPSDQDGIASPFAGSETPQPGVVGDGVTSASPTPAVEVEAPTLGPIGEAERPPEIHDIC
jgi:hypothetical protein